MLSNVFCLFNATPTTEIYTLSLHDALPIYDGRIIEVQGTAEGEPFSHEELLKLLELAKNGIATIIDAQRQALKD